LPTVEMESVACDRLSYEGLNFVEINDELNMIRISQLVKKPILRWNKEYFILDTGVCYHHKPQSTSH
jgi:hypothetical protein